MPLSMVHDHILIQRDPFEERSAGGLFVATASQQGFGKGDPRTKNCVATVLEVGPGGLTDEGERKPMSVSKGDRIIVSTFGGDPISYRAEAYEIIKDEHVKAVIVREKGWVDFTIVNNSAEKVIRGGDDWFDYVEARASAVGIPKSEMLIQVLLTQEGTDLQFGLSETHKGQTLKAWAESVSLDLQIK